MNPRTGLPTQAPLPPLNVSTTDDPRVVREAATEDYSLHVVPRSWRLGRLRLAMAWSSLLTAMFWIVVGATIALAVGTVDAIIGMALSAAVYGVINYALTRVATTSGLTVALLSRGLLGYFGAAVATLVFAAGAIYFATFEASVLSVAFQAQFGGSIALWYGVTILYALPLVIGGVRRWLDRLNAALLPLFVVGVIAAVIWSVVKYGYSDKWLHIPAASGSGIAGPGWLFAFSVFMGVWLIMFYTVDFARLGKTEHARFNGAVTFGPVFYTFAILANGLVGIFLTSTLPSSGTVSEASLVVGIVNLMGISGLIFIFATQTKINSANLYLASANLESFFSRVFGVRLPRWFWVGVAGLACYLFMLTNIFTFLLKALNYQATVVVAWVAIVLVELAFRRARREGLLDFRPGRVPAANVPGLTAWIVASALGITLLVATPAFAGTWGAPLTFVAAVALYAVLRGRFGNPTDRRPRPNDPRDEVSDVWGDRVRCHRCEKSYVAVEMDRDPSASYAPVCASCATSPAFLSAAWREMRPHQ
ncbi:cytosine permease [Amycolatopsis sp. GM8]|uniref:purine-cytosine permease family protein n=1 Tax=Amycolatopsis sp. GM8 TaxID=2896530 RepID=UPI001F2D73EF|nr:thiamine permease [Amycolatopsis sp. GM8]